MIKIRFETTFSAVVFTICLAYKLKNFLPGDVTCCRRTDPLTLFTFTGITNLLSSNIGKSNELVNDTLKETKRKSWNKENVLELKL